jgi:ubiquinone/menaquinone biosynthesis C-methylase UbiE
MGITIDERLENERIFHDDRYRHDPREAQDKFYEGLAESEGRFHELVERFEPGQRVLELGCGIDSLAYRLADRGLEVVGIDISPVAVDKARAVAAEKESVRASFEVMNAESLAFDDNSFDGVIGTAVLHHLDVASACAEMSRVLRPGGRAVFIEPLGHNPAINAYRRRTPDSRTEFEHPLRWEDYGLAQRYFEDVQIDTFHLLAIVTSPFAGRWWGKHLHQLTTAIDRRVLAFSERLRWQGWIAVSEFRRPR